MKEPLKNMDPPVVKVNGADAVIAVLNPLVPINQRLAIADPVGATATILYPTPPTDTVPGIITSPLPKGTTGRLIVYWLEPKPVTFVIETDIVTLTCCPYLTKVPDAGEPTAVKPVPPHTGV